LALLFSLFFPAQPSSQGVPALGPFLTFFDARCDTASVSAEVFDHAGAPVAGQRVSLTASSSLSRDHALSGRQDS
jgi:hypothetical protein